ncbi:inhibitor of Bruton tyrosine kinase-like isoform X2 [Penaeus japonicus]|uniref:inhibitor of Bruton tyrosine kinase-like isoform X2 n=1 Tax=Penaeus japonicus TaxID=27405 RepID=UPI001C715565|nr:inhibitor of Bruton tyrosine kinase-like isoform X2 [Penaeus japonicus]
MNTTLSPECTLTCRSRQHGSQITAAIIRGTEAQAISYMKNMCQQCCVVTDITGKTALHTAVSCGKKKVVQWLLCQGVPLNQRDWENGYTPLHRALFYGQIHAACALLKAGANLCVQDHDSLTPLDHVNFDRPLYVTFSQSLPTQIYVWGSNTNYNLGQTRQNDKGIPECLDMLQREGQHVVDVAMNKFHTLILTKSGRVYACGHGHGGRLGLSVHTPLMKPHMIKALANTTVSKVSVGTDHSLFLTESGQVWSCGTNTYHQLGVNPPVDELYIPQPLTWHKSHKEETINGIGAAKYHSVIWTSKILYTFGLNAGQLGHFKNLSERTIITPRKVTSVTLQEEGRIACIAVSDGATVVCTSCGDIYVLHQYQTRKIASKMRNIAKVACVGGCLDSSVNAEGLTEKGGTDLKIAVLTGEGSNHLYLWTEQSSHLSRCLFNINREVNVRDFCLSHHLIGIVTKEGEAFSANIILPRKHKITNKSFNKSTGQLVEFLDRSSCVTLRLTRIANLHRTLSIVCDPKGSNFAAIQNEPNCFLVDVPQISPSTLKGDFRTLLIDVNEMDNIHDVIIVCGQKRFCAHSYILACHSQYFRECLLNNVPGSNKEYLNVYRNSSGEEEKKFLIIPDVDPDVFREILTFMYTGTCQLLTEPEQFISAHAKNMHDSCRITAGKTFCPIPGEEKIQSKYWNKNKRRKGRKESETKAYKESTIIDLRQMALSIARKYEIKALEQEINNMSDHCGIFEEDDMNNSRNTTVQDVKIKYSRKTNQELWDVTISSKTGDNLGAHKCVLSARSEYFNCMFGASWIESTSSKALSMPLPTNILVIILDYLYEDDSTKLRQCREPEFICNVLVVADQFLVTRLCEICEDVLVGLLTLKNAADLLEFACIYNAKQLKMSAMQFICLNLAAVLENGSLLTISNSEILVDLSVYYRKFISQMCYRMLTPYDQSPYADELEKLLEQNPVVLPESDEEWEDTYVRDRQSKSSGQGSSRKKKRSHKNSQSESRTRNSSTSSQFSLGSLSDSDSLKDLEQELEALTFDDLEERPTKDIANITTHFEKNESHSELIIPKDGNFENHNHISTENSPWQKIRKKKNSADQLLLTTQSLAKENVDIKSFSNNIHHPDKIPQVQPVIQKTEDSPRKADTLGKGLLIEFPSLRDSLSCTPRVLDASPNKLVKMGKTSQKQYKKLSLSGTALEKTSTGKDPKQKITTGSSPWNHSSPAWGAGKDVIKSDVKDLHTLADIMKAERTSYKETSIQSSTPIPIQKVKTSQATTTAKKGWGMTDTHPVHQRTPDSEGSGLWSQIATSPPTSPQTSSSHISHGSGCSEKAQLISQQKKTIVPNFSSILKEEEIQTSNLRKERLKTLGLIQIEDKAIEELLMFYGAADCFDEKLTVKRVRQMVANPVWNK